MTRAEMDLIEAKLPGSPRDQERRAKLLQELLQALDVGGPDAVTDALAARLGELEREFNGALGDLRKRI